MGSLVIYVFCFSFIFLFKMFPSWHVSSVIVHRTLRSCRNMQVQTQGPAFSLTLWKGTVHHGTEPYAPLHHLDRALGRVTSREYPCWILSFFKLVRGLSNLFIFSKNQLLVLILSTEFLFAISLIYFYYFCF